MAQLTELELSEFLLRACHDLRTALRAVRTHAELLLRDGEPAQGAAPSEHLGFIIDGARKIDLLTDGMASYSIALQIQRQSLQPVPLNVLLRAVLAKLDRELQGHQATVTYDSLPRVSGDPDRLMEVFENLLLNAVRHRGVTAPVVHVTAEERDAEWLFSVRDNGPGVEAASLESIFQPFARLHGRRHPGAGLGLAICRAVVERHGGRIWAESNDGGATFFFTLPRE